MGPIYSAYQTKFEMSIPFLPLVKYKTRNSSHIFLIAPLKLIIAWHPRTNIWLRALLTTKGDTSVSPLLKEINILNDA